MRTLQPTNEPSERDFHFQWGNGDQAQPAPEILSLEYEDEVGGTGRIVTDIALARPNALRMGYQITLVHRSLTVSKTGKPPEVIWFDVVHTDRKDDKMLYDIRIQRREVL